MYNPKLHFHFCGIGGSGMSGIAEILLNLGFKVSGSDIKLSETCRHLQSLGAQIYLGHSGHNLPEGCSLLVYSSAVRADNPELQEARARQLPVIRRAEVLAELMRLKYAVGVAGSHGKTTTTSMIAAILERGNLDPTVIIGGRVKSMSSGGKLGKSQYLVAETDESDRSFLLLKPTLAVVTNIDAEHMNAYDSLADLEGSFDQFVASVPFYGLAVLCIDDTRVRDLAGRCKGRKITYGVSPDANLRAQNFSFDRSITSYDVYQDGNFLMHVDLPMPGKHLALNSLAAIAVGLEFGIAPEFISAALNQFSGVARRLEICSETNGITVMNDYGHHPAEVRATLAAIRAGWAPPQNRIKVIFQPHRYTRTRDCFAEFLQAFADSDELIISDIYAASEDPIEGVTAELLAQAVTHPNCRYVKDLSAIVDLVCREAKTGDIILCLGAGSIGQMSEDISKRLQIEQGMSVLAA